MLVIGVGYEHMKKNILIINEDEEETKALKQRLQGPTTEVFCTLTMQEALTCFVKHDFCLIVLDANMSEEDDHKLLKAMRTAKSTPIMILSTQSDHTGRIHALQVGAHAYLGQPYSHEECMAQAHALIQLYLDSSPHSGMCYTLAFGNNLVIDPSTRRVFLHEKELKMTRKEFDLLFWLASNPGKVFSKEQLYDHVWDDQTAYNVDSVIKTHISSLRQKLSVANQEYIKNVWGVGYRFCKDEGDK